MAILTLVRWAIMTNPMQHDVFVNPGSRTRLVRPYLTVLQANVVEGPSKLVCPLYRLEYMQRSRTAPVVHVLGVEFRVGVEVLFAVPANTLRKPVASVAAYRDDIIYALDWLFTGI